MKNINEATEKFEEMQELAKKYADYKPGDATKIVYHEPETKEQAEKARKIKSRNANIALAVAAVFLLMLVMTIVTKMELWKIMLMAVLTAVPVIFAVKEKTDKVAVMTGRAVYKQVRVQEIGTNKKTYYVSVIPDSGEKVIYTLIQISKEDYEKVTEGTPVMVVNGYACVM